jgi:hypothetical protein
MSYPHFSEGTQRLLSDHPSLPSSRSRELGSEFLVAQARVCRSLGRLSYPLCRMLDELAMGQLPYFREGSDQDRKEGGKKSGYRFAGISPSLEAEYRRRRAETGGVEREFAQWESDFLQRFTFELIEQVALRAQPAPAPEPSRTARSENAIHPAWNVQAELTELAAALAAARVQRDQMLAGNLLLVAQIAIRRSRAQREFTLDDLFAAGTDGLFIAINRYDPTVALFSTYATPWIAMAIDRFAANNRHVIRLPIGLQAKLRRVGEPAGALIPSTVSLEEPRPGAGPEDEGCIADTIADSAVLRPLEGMERAELTRRLEAGIASLGGLKQFIVALRSEVGDAASLGAALFRQEAELSRARGRATAVAAEKTLDQPARIRRMDSPAETAEHSAPVGSLETVPLPMAV